VKKALLLPGLILLIATALVFADDVVLPKSENATSITESGLAGWQELSRVYWGTQPAQVERTVSEGELGNVPTGMSVDGSGNINILDRVNNKVVIFTEGGAFLRSIQVDGLAKGSSWILVDTIGNIVIVSKKNYKPYELYVYSPNGELLSQAVFPAKINNVRGFVAPGGKIFLWADESRFDIKTQKSQILSRLNYTLNEKYELTQAKSGSIGRFHPEALVHSAEISFGNRPFQRAIVFLDPKGGVIGKLDVEKFMAVDSYGRIFKLKSKDELDVMDLKGRAIMKIPFAGGHAYGGFPILGNDGNIYQIDLIPNVPKEMQHVQTGAPPTDMNYSIDSPGIRVLKYVVNK